MLRDMEQSQNAEETLEHWSSFEGKIAKNDEGDFLKVGKTYSKNKKIFPVFDDCVHSAIKSTNKTLTTMAKLDDNQLETQISTERGKVNKNGVIGTNQRLECLEVGKKLNRTQLRRALRKKPKQKLIQKHKLFCTDFSFAFDLFDVSIIFGFNT